MASNETQTLTFVVRVPWWLHLVVPVWGRILWLAHVTCPACIDLDTECDRFANWVARRIELRVKE